MKLKGLIAVAVILLTPSLMSAEPDNPWNRKLPFEQAVITYEIIGLESGREVLYLRDFGTTTARHRETSTTVLGITQKNSSVEITTPDWIYFFDLQQKTGSKSVNPQKLMIEEYDKLSTDEKKKISDNARGMANMLMGGLQGSVEPNVKQLLGYSCDRTTALGSTVYFIHDTGISLLSETDLLGIKMKIVATSIQETGAEKRYFEFPEGIVVQHDKEADRMAQMIAQQSMSALKDPEGHSNKGQGFMGMPSGEQPAIPQEDQMEMEEAMKTIKGLLGN